MNFSSITTDDGIPVKYAYIAGDRSRRWIALAMPFGLNMTMAQTFFDFFGSHYNVCTWECRSILEDSDRKCDVSEFAIDRHVDDLLAVLDDLGVKEAVMIGYCSGAGLALAAMNAAPDRFSELILANGEFTFLHDSSLVTPFAADMDTLMCLAEQSDKHANFVFERLQSERFDLDSGRPKGLDNPFSELRFLKRYAMNYVVYKAVDFTRLADEIMHPCMIMAAGRDIQVNIASARKIHERIRNAELFIDEEADHYGVLTKDSETLVTIWNFLCENAHARQQRRLHS